MTPAPGEGGAGPILAQQVLTGLRGFDPDRWTARSGSDPAVRRAYVPFGAGPTKCLGERFASAEAVLALASILTRRKLELCGPRTAQKPDSRLVLLPRTLPVRLTSRAETPSPLAKL